MYDNFGALLLSTIISTAFVLIPLCCFYLIQKSFLRGMIISPNWMMKCFGLVAVPIHELSHAMGCLIFGHKINKLVLLDFNLSNGTLVYVDHSYSPTSLWQVIGTFFIAVAPVFGGIFVIGLSTVFLIGNGEDWLIELWNVGATNDPQGSLIKQAFVHFKDCFTVNYNYVLMNLHESTGLTSVWALLIATIGLYLTPSAQDLRGSLKGFIVIMLLLFSIQLLLHDTINFEYVQSLSICLSSILMLGLTASLMLLLITRFSFGCYAYISK